MRGSRSLEQVNTEIELKGLRCCKARSKWLSFLVERRGELSRTIRFVARDTVKMFSPEDKA